MRTGRRRRCRRRAGSPGRTRRRSGGRATVGAEAVPGARRRSRRPRGAGPARHRRRARRSATCPPGRCRSARPAAGASAAASEGSASSGGRSRRTSAASSGSPTGVSPSGVEALAARSAAELGRSVIRCSCAVGRRRASSLAAATSSRVHANLSRDGRLGRRDWDAGRPSDVARQDLGSDRICDGWTDLEIRWTRFWDCRSQTSGTSHMSL